MKNVFPTQRQNVQRPVNTCSKRFASRKGGFQGFPTREGVRARMQSALGHLCSVPNAGKRPRACFDIAAGANLEELRRGCNENLPLHAIFICFRRETFVKRSLQVGLHTFHQKGFQTFCVRFEGPSKSMTNPQTRGIVSTEAHQHFAHPFDVLHPCFAAAFARGQFKRVVRRRRVACHQHHISVLQGHGDCHLMMRPNPTPQFSTKCPGSMLCCLQAPFCFRCPIGASQNPRHGCLPKTFASWFGAFLLSQREFRGQSCTN